MKQVTRRDIEFISREFERSVGSSSRENARSTAKYWWVFVQTFLPSFFISYFPCLLINSMLVKRSIELNNNKAMPKHQFESQMSSLGLCSRHSAVKLIFFVDFRQKKKVFFFKFLCDEIWFDFSSAEQICVGFYCAHFFFAPSINFAIGIYRWAHKHIHF